MKTSKIPVVLFRYGVAIFRILWFIIPVKKKKGYSKKKVLILRSDAIGDFFIWLAHTPLMREVYPKEEFELSLFCESALEEFARKLPFFDNVITFDRKKMSEPYSLEVFLYEKTLFDRLHDENFDIAIQSRYSRDFFCDDMTVLSSGAPVKITVEGDSSNIRSHLKNITDRFYIKIIPNSGEIHEYLKNLDFISNLAGRVIIDKSDTFPLDFLSSMLPREFKKRSNYFVVSPGASGSYKQWNIENFVSVAVSLYEKTKWECVLLGSQSEKDMEEAFSQHFSNGLKNFIGKTSVAEMAAWILNARLVITNDTAAVHIAAACGTPSVCILGGGHFGRFLPYPEELKLQRGFPTAIFHHMDCFNCNWKCIYTKNKEKPYPCIQAVKVEVVRKAIMDKIEKMPDN